MNNAARPELLSELRALRVVRVLRLLFRVQVIEVAEELVEAVVRGQELVFVTQMILAELSRRVTELLEYLRDGGILRTQSDVRSGQTHFRQSSSNGRLPRDERRATSRAALLPVPVGEHRTFLTDAIDVRRLIPHDAPVIDAGVKPADVVAHDDEDVRLALRRLLLLCPQWPRGETGNRTREPD